MADQTDKAVGLWTILQEEGEVPSKHFLSYLGKHLKSKNMEVPFVMPNVGAQEVNTKEKQTNLPTKNDISTQMESLVQDGKAVKAMDIALKSINKGVMPQIQVLKYVLKSLAEEGCVEKIKELGQHLTDPLKKRLAYDDKLTLATFKKGAGIEHIDTLVQEAEAANTLEEFEVVLKKFPRSSALASVVNNETAIAKCKFIVIITPYNFYTILNHIKTIH